jgi:POT family proton-dependent oligopeptide transporter
MKQPRALRYLFSTELWERFGFYAIQSLLIIYMTHRLNYNDKTAYAILGSFTAWAYIAPLAGGFISDRILGFRHSILIGAILLCAGYFSLTLFRDNLFLFSLATIITGNGLLKPNISGYLGEFYYDDDPRRNSGFTFFYMGINAGGLLSTLFSGFIQTHIGWTTTFGVATIGMLIGIVTFLRGYKHYENKGLPIPINKIKPRFLKKLSNRFILILLFLLSILGVRLLLANTHLSDIVLATMGILIIIILGYLIYSYDKNFRNRLIVLIVLTAAAVVFWSELLQIFFSIDLFTERSVQRTFFGITIPPSSFIALEPIFILLTGPVLAALWEKLAANKIDPTPSTKFALSMLLVATAMAVLATSVHFEQHSLFINPLWIVAFYFLLTLAEMFLSPIGLALVTELSPPQLTGFLMGVWLVAIGFGGSLAGTLAKKASIPSGIANDPAAVNSIYSHAFTSYAFIALGTSMVLFLITPFLNRILKHRPKTN